MKTNYAEHLALFQYNVRSNIISDHDKNTRCWHTSIKKPAIYRQRTSEPCNNHKKDSCRENPRKRKRFKFEMEHNSEEEIDLKMMPESSVTLPTATTSDETNDLPVRSMSDLSLYYDAERDWIDENEPTFLEQNSPSIQPSTSSIPRVNRREELKSILFSSFGAREFIPNQYEAITASLNYEDMLVVLPAGPPRDICYQLPMLFYHKKLITIVIVPSIIQLWEHDDHNLQHHNIPTAFVSKSKKNHKPNWMSIAELELKYINSYQLVYMTYSDFTEGQYIITQLANENLLSRIVIDEAHCISQWGPDFHFGYLRAARHLKTMFPTVPLTALTAISNERVQIDIMHNLSIFGTCKIFNKSILL